MIDLDFMYKIDGRIVYVSGTAPEEHDGNLLITAYECIPCSDENNGSLFYSGFLPAGKPFMLNVKELEKAENINEPCLTCIYCKRVEQTKPNGNERYLFSSCELRAGIAADYYDRGFLFADCLYRLTEKPFTPVETNAHGFDVKAYFRLLSKTYKPMHIKGFYMLMPSVFEHLVSLVQPDEPIYLATGESLVEGRRFVHEEMSEYLENARPDVDTICLKAKNASKELYGYLNSDLMDIFYSLVCIPSLDLAVYADDWTDGRGITIFAQEELTEMIAKENQIEREAAQRLFAHADFPERQVSVKQLLVRLGIKTETEDQ